MKKIYLSLLVILIFTLTVCASEKKKSDYDVIVIGSGGGGLSAAAKLTLAGKKVLVLEKQGKVGGYMTNFKRGDYLFEVSLHGYNGLDEKYGTEIPTLKELDIWKRLKPVRTATLYRLIRPDITIDADADPEKYKQMLIEKFPAEKSGIEDIFLAVKKLNDMYYVGLDMMRGNYFKAMWGGLTHPVAFWKFFKYRNSSASEFIDDYIKDKTLKSIFLPLSSYLGDTGDKVPGLLYSAALYSYHYGGYYYFEGGSQSISNALANVIRENKGKILLSTAAVKIIIKDNRATAVRVEDQNTKEVKEYTCDYVVSNVNAPDTFLKLVGEENIPADYIKNLKSMVIGLSSFTVYLGVKKDYSKFFPEHSHALYITDFINDDDNNKARIKGDLSKMGFGLVNYTVMDPASAPSGKNVLCISTLLPYDTNDGWKLNQGYDKYTQYKKELALMLIKRAEKYLPELSENIEIMEVGTPVTNINFTSNPEGSIIGWANTPEQSMMNRLPQDTPVKNLFLAGAWTRLIGGQSTVLISGCMASEMILND